jgi:hypothetical protein
LIDVVKMLRILRHSWKMPLASSLELVKLTAYADPLPG